MRDWGNMTVERKSRLAYSAGMDAANRHMRAHGRTAWDASDYAVCEREMRRVYPTAEWEADVRREEQPR